MTEIVLQSGEALRIRSARGTLLVLRAGPSRGAWDARRYLQIEEERRRALLRALG